MLIARVAGHYVAIRCFSMLRLRAVFFFHASHHFFAAFRCFTPLRLRRLLPIRHVTMHMLSDVTGVASRL